MNLFYVLIFFSITTTLQGCKDKPDADGSSDLNYPLETAELISQATSGIIQKDGSIEVRFSAPVIQENLISQTLTKNVFTFDPPIAGVTIWKDRQTLSFEPSEDLAARGKYSATLDVAALLPLHKEKLTSFPFQFEVAGRELAGLEHDFKLVNKDDPAKLQVVGTLKFSEAIGQEEVKNAVVLTRNGRSLPLTWNGDGLSFSFTSSEITRGNSSQSFELKIDNKPVDISQSLSETFTLSPLRNLYVDGVQKQGAGDNLNLIVEFSDDLDAAQDLQGLIRVEPSANTKIKVVGRRAYISGNFDFGREYNVLVSKGVRSRFGTKTQALTENKVKLEDLKPQVKFAGSGVFSPTANNRKVRFQAINVRAARVEVKRVFES
ncbi:MAG: hypothetical protein AAFP70_02655, partial [Calditrichota bacterium]